MSTDVSDEMFFLGEYLVTCVTLSVLLRPCSVHPNGTLGSKRSGVMISNSLLTPKDWLKRPLSFSPLGVPLGGCQFEQCNECCRRVEWFPPHPAVHSGTRR